MLIQTNFVSGKMNKSVDERLVPVGEYVDAMNVRLGSTETTEIGAVENSRGNTILTNIEYLGDPLSDAARCIGAYEDGMRETIYWFVHDESNPNSGTGVVDLILSFNTQTGILVYHILSESVLNFDNQYLITGVNKIGDFLYFTDDLNPPRYIDINRFPAYPTDTTLSPIQLQEEDISVIVKIPGFEDPTPLEPLGVPHVAMLSNQSSEDYLENRFICFAYRYRYLNGAYSATSLFTKPAFLPQEFDFSLENYQNEGMLNKYNAANITFSTGTHRVTEIQLLYKETTSNQIYIIDRYNKADLGWPDNTFITRQFTNSKILAVIGSDELLRLYDNVPRLAKAQTIQGNRLMYGNYVDQYNITRTEGGSVIPIRYNLDPVSVNIGGVDFPDTTITTSSGLINMYLPRNIVDNKITFDISSLGSNIPAGLELRFRLAIQNVRVEDNGGPDAVTAPIIDFEISLNFVTTVPYPSPADLLNDPAFAEAVGTASNIQPILPPSAPTAVSTGTTLTDFFNASIYGTLTSTAGNQLQLLNTSRTGTCPAIPLSVYPPVTSLCLQQPIGLSTSGNSFTLQLPGAQFYFDRDPASPGTPGNFTNQYNYFAFNPSLTQAGYSTIIDNSSLHSQRDYEVGIVYMDEYGRASTVLTAENNTLYFPATTMTQKNQIQVTLDRDQPAPYWAEKYKFVIKPSQGNYNMIYSNMVYQQDGTGEGAEGLSTADNSSFWFRLEGDSQNLVKVGDVLTVKMDANGPVNATTRVEVLDKEPMYSKQITDVSQPGLYIRLKPSGWAAINPAVPPNISCSKSSDNGSSSNCAAQRMNCGVNDPALSTAAAIPAGSVVKLSFAAWRGRSGSNCRQKKIVWKKSIVATQNYASIHAMLVGEQLQNQVTTATATDVDAMNISFDPILYSSPTITGTGPSVSCFNAIAWVAEESVSGQQYVSFNPAIEKCSGSWGVTQHGKGKLKVDVSFSQGLFAFETEPQAADPNLFYDASDLLEIKTDIATGLKTHQATRVFNPTTQLETIVDGCVDGPCQDQVLGSLPLRTLLQFANCYAFGNGVESFRIQDRIDGKFFQLGQRQLAVSNQDFGEADRFASMTYSGVFSDSANSNNLNEFNLGLVNYKDLETSFGPVMKLHSRETDILILQEDRISYILASKNVITDSTGGGAIASVPEVLGTQIARIEEYGISFNPESFSSWGYAMFFTDTKRGAVLMLQGSSANSDQLTAINTYGMRSWFRDEFNANLTTQKLGGYDPYMNEYVLSSNDRQVPIPIAEVPCGQQLSQYGATATVTYDVILGPIIGNVNIPYTITAGTIKIDITWNGVVYSSGNVSASGSFNFNKTASTPDTANVVITPITDSATYDVEVECPPEVPLTIIEVVVNTSNYSGETIHTAFKWNDGTTFSPTAQSAISLNLSTPTSYYNTLPGVRSVGMHPYDGANITLRTNKIPPDTFDFNPALHRFKILSSNNLYQNNALDIATLLTTAPNVTPILNPMTNEYEATESAFSMPLANEYLYLIWDFRDVIYNELCYSTISILDVCCECETTCGSCYFSPVQTDIAGACMVDTNTFGWNTYSFNGLGSIPELGNIVYANTGCDFGLVAPAGFYIVDIAQPSAAVPKNWIEVDAGGIVVNTGTC